MALHPLMNFLYFAFRICIGFIVLDAIISDDSTLIVFVSSDWHDFRALDIVKNK